MNLPFINFLKNGSDGLLAQISLHLKLIQIEWALEKLRYKRMLYLLLFGVPLLVCSLLAAGMLVMMLSWDTEVRLTAAFVLFLAYSAGAWFVVYRLLQESALGHLAFAETRREIAVDLGMLRSRFGD